MFEKRNKQHNSSHDVEDGDGDGTDAVEYGSCQHPVVFHLILPVGLVRYDTIRDAILTCARKTT